ncbi:hypothetical protein MVES1_000816 [Malassezia vespertilionis]|uniref:uncharacterized protein n=1 Tax=Malassezia vespertilionis TaxID=2020962 RepID=UPI0024B0A7A1|nr:uncharacterized protein MVES1_000816 [Malassezia vespertilionis]WFD05486.1 hypothetical protein MVES1_000816 [Malassezia vespertilionis]
MYEDQRSTVLAVDNLNGAQVLGRTLRVDHVNSYKQERTRDAEGNLVEPEEETFNCAPPETIVDDEADEDNIDLSDPMAAYFADENKRRRSEKKLNYGYIQSRGERAGQEDAMSVACVMLPCDQLRENIKHASREETSSRAPWAGWSCEEAGGADIGAQVAWFACFDGHGGGAVSKLLSEKLHRVFEQVSPDMATDTVRYTRSIGGYFGRFTGGPLERWVHKDSLNRAQHRQEHPNRMGSLAELASLAQSKAKPARLEQYDAFSETRAPDTAQTERVAHVLGLRDAQFTLEERATLAWLMMDREVQQNEVYRNVGSTASVLLLHSLDQPAKPWYDSEYVSLTTVQLGDTRFVLCSTEDGNAIPLTLYHHPDEPSEANRLQRLGAGIVTDSFGEMRWMGTLANTRAFGDAAAKKLGVTAEPDVRSHVIQGDQAAFVIGFSDGIGDVMSDQEVVDCCRGAKHPQDAAKSVLRYAEAIGSEDNATVLCIPLRGWGHIKGQDWTKAQRKQRVSEVDLFRDRRK